MGTMRKVRKMGAYKTFKQYDSRWGRKNYNGSSTVAASACGPTAIACLAHAVNEKITPLDTIKYMQKHGYAIYKKGTAWAGIPACMKAYGLKDVKNVVTMPDVWSYLSKGYCAVFLMTYDYHLCKKYGIVWTTDGHFIAITGYKVKDGKHWVYVHDPGGRDHDGWYCYETQMRGLISQVWVGYVEGKLKPVKPTNPKTLIKKANAWADKTIKSNEYSYKRWNSKNKKTQICPICNKLTGEYKGWNCIGFVSAYLYHGAGLKNIECSCKGVGDDSFFNNVTIKSWRARNGENWDMITNGGKKGGSSIQAKNLKDGDVLVGYDNSGKFKHIVIYRGDGKYSDSTGTAKPNVGTRKYTDLTKRMNITRAFRMK